MTFGEQVREWRIERKINQRDLAAKVGIDFTYLSKIENGKMPPPSEATIVKIARTLEKDADTLLRLASKVPDDLKPIITSSREAPALLRAFNGLSDGEVRLLIERAEKMKRSQISPNETSSERGDQSSDDGT